MVREEWLRDPKHVGFVLARYKFVAKMVAGLNRVAEVGAGDGWASELVVREVHEATLTDARPRREGVTPHDILAKPVGEDFDACYSVDVIEHVDPQMTWTFLENMADSVRNRGMVIVGTPSIESQAWASEDSRREHVNCFSFERLRSEMRKHFDPVLMFCQNDEVVHTGFPRLAHYLWAIGVR